MDVVIEPEFGPPLEVAPSKRKPEIPEPRVLWASFRTVVVVAVLIGVGSLVVVEMLPILSARPILAHCCDR